MSLPQPACQLTACMPTLHHQQPPMLCNASGFRAPASCWLLGPHTVNSETHSPYHPHRHWPLKPSSAGPDSPQHPSKPLTSCVASSAMTPASGRRRAHERLTLPLPCHSLGLEPGWVQMETVSSCGSLACAFLQPHGADVRRPGLTWPNRDRKQLQQVEL